MSESSECEYRAGCCCSQCLSPDVITELSEDAPWEIGFSRTTMLTGSTYVGGAPVSFTFRIFPGVAS